MSNDNDLSWLDKYIEKQADYYNMSVSEFTKFMSDMADAQEIIENKINEVMNRE